MKISWTRNVALALAVALLAGPALAQTPVTVQNPSFEWTGKEGDQANFRWTAIVDNPSSRDDLRVRVSLEMLDDAGNVVGSDSTEMLLPEEDQVSIERDARIAVSTAQQASDYRVTIVEIED